jgi:hypothetical protein
MSEDDTKTARVAYLRLLKDEFYRFWPHGQRRSSEPGEREAFDKARAKIAALTEQIEEDLR